MKRLALDSVRIRNFKAIDDSGQIKLTPLTVLIGENGSGKSSLIEALETLQTIVVENLDDAMRPWKGFNEIWPGGRLQVVLLAGEPRASLNLSHRQH